MSPDSQKLYDTYKSIQQKGQDLNSAAALLEWDQEVYMPPKSADFRARQLSTLASMSHELLTGNELEDAITQLAKANDLSDEQQANIRLSKEDLDKNKKLPAEFVEALSRQTSECFNAWIAARKKNDYSIFAPSLAKMIALKQQQAKLYGDYAHPYDALLDDYEKGATVAMLDELFAKIKEQLPPLLAKIKQAAQVSNDCFHQHFAKQQQWDFSLDVLTKMGYDMEAGRQDYAEHPFTTSFSATDVRITTRVDEDNYASMLWSTIHEGGHALYEQGLPEEQYGLPLGSAASLGIHESQSRFWENCVGRSKDFWQHFYPILQRRFPEQLSNVSRDTFYKAMNRVEPSLIRTEADEVTYHFHVMIRYEIEKGLLENKIDVKDLPQVWNDLYEKYLGVRPADDKTGILQDVHWSHGSFGYFPTYSLGSFYAAQFYHQVQKEISDIGVQITKGDFRQLLQWLREHIHIHGRRYTSEELCERITGQRLDTNHFLQYINNKYSGIYG